MPGYVLRNQVAVDPAVLLGRALVDIVSYCADEDVPLSGRQQDLVAGCLMWAYHRMQQEADSGVRHVPGVRVQPSDSLRRLVLERDEFRCRKCGEGGEAADLHLDHVLPVVHGGETSADNLQVLCGPCNLSKSADAVRYV